MNCKNAQALLSAYLDEELTGREMLEMRAHLNDCDACAEELRCVEGVKRLLSAAPVPAPSDDFEERLVSTVLAAAPAPAERRISFVALAGIAAASMLITMLLMNVMRPASPSVVDDHEDMATQLVRRDRAFSASSDPLSGSPVMFGER